MIALSRSLIASPSALLASSDARQLGDLLKITAGAGAIIGAVAGLQHDGLQALYSAVKMPLMLVIPPLLVLPALLGLANALDLDLSARRAAPAAIAASARTAVFGAALAPVYWLLTALSGGSYTVGVFGLAATMALAGLFGWAVLACAPTVPSPRPLRSLAFTIGAGGLFFLAAAQAGWHLRPFVLRQELPSSFLAPPQGDVYSDLKSKWDAT